MNMDEYREMFDEFKEMFKVLEKAKDVLGEKMWKKIRRKLVEGGKAQREANYLQGLRKSAEARQLGMTDGEYEDFLGGTIISFI